MAKFRFNLQAVLEQRRAAERTKQLAVAEIERARLDLENQIRRYQDQLAREREDLRAHLTPGVSAGAVDLRGVRLQASASLGLVASAHRAALQLAGVHRRLDAARQELIAATTRRRAVDALKERHLDEWKHENNRRENAALDELAVMNAARRQDTP